MNYSLSAAAAQYSTLARQGANGLIASLTASASAANVYEGQGKNNKTRLDHHHHYDEEDDTANTTTTTTTQLHLSTACTTCGQTVTVPVPEWITQAISTTTTNTLNPTVDNDDDYQSYSQENFKGKGQRKGRGGGNRSSGRSEFVETLVALAIALKASPVRLWLSLLVLQRREQRLINEKNCKKDPSSPHPFLQINPLHPPLPQHPFLPLPKNNFYSHKYFRRFSRN